MWLLPTHIKAIYRELSLARVSGTQAKALFSLLITLGAHQAGLSLQIMSIERVVFFFFKLL